MQQDSLLLVQWTMASVVKNLQTWKEERKGSIPHDALVLIVVSSILQNTATTLVRLRLRLPQ